MMPQSNDADRVDDIQTFLSRLAVIKCSLIMYSQLTTLEIHFRCGKFSLSRVSRLKAVFLALIKSNFRAILLLINYEKHFYSFLSRQKRRKVSLMMSIEQRLKKIPLSRVWIIQGIIKTLFFAKIYQVCWLIANKFVDIFKIVERNFFAFPSRN